MSKYNLLEVLEDLIREMNFQCEWAIVWEEKQSFINLNFQFSLANPQQYLMRDVTNLHSDLKEIPFEFGVILYDNRLLTIDGMHQIKSIPINSEQGIAYGELVCIVKYLKKLTSMVEVRWHLFLEDSDALQFTMVWDEDEFSGIKQTLVDNHRYSQFRVFFPKTNI